MIFNQASKTVLPVEKTWKSILPTRKFQGLLRINLKEASAASKISFTKKPLDVMHIRMMTYIRKLVKITILFIKNKIKQQWPLEVEQHKFISPLLKTTIYPLLVCIYHGIQLCKKGWWSALLINDLPKIIKIFNQC